MKHPILLLIFLASLFPAFIQPSDQEAVRLPENVFKPGETLHYNVRFGWFSVGEADVKIAPDLSQVDQSPTYKVDVYGRTSGMVDWVAQVDDHWGSFVDTASLIPHKSIRNIREGKYKKDEITRFDHINNKAITTTLDQKTGRYKEPKSYDTPANIRDILAGFLYLRTVDFSKLKKGESFVIQGFLSDKVYTMEMVYEGKDEVKTKAGKFNAIKIIPLMPDGDLFDGKRSVTLWLSDDPNRVPLRMEAKMFVGKTAVELESYKNLLH